MAEYSNTRVEEDLCNNICDYLKDAHDDRVAMVMSFEEDRDQYDVGEVSVLVNYEDIDGDAGRYLYSGTLGQFVDDIALHQSGKTRGLGR